MPSAGTSRPSKARFHTACRSRAHRARLASSEASSAREALAADDALGSVLDGLLEAQERNLA
jgi:hypothetical protein